MIKSIVPLLVIGILIFMSTSAYAVSVPMWSDPAGNGQGWYQIPSNFSWYPAIPSPGGEPPSNDNLWGNWTGLPSPGGMGAACDQRGSSEKCNVYVENDGYSNGTYSLVFTINGQAGLEANVTIEVNDLMGTKKNYTIYCAGTGGYFCNTSFSTQLRYDGTGIPIYVNQTGVLGFRMIVDERTYNSTCLDCNYPKVTGLNVTNFTAGSSKNIEIILPLNTTYLNKSVPLNVTYHNFIVDKWFYDIDSSGNVSFTPNTTVDNIPNGTHHIRVWANETVTGAVFYDDINFQNDWGVRITIPQNTTYYNNFTINLNVTNSSFNAINWSYSVNGGTNVSFMPNTTLTNNFYGGLCVDVWANDSANAWYTNQVCWTNSPYPQTAIVNVCNSSNVGKTSCSADGFSILNCIRMTYTSYQWDPDNVTNCPYGCWNGACLVPNKTCSDACTPNSQKCIDGNNYANCTYNSNTGCYGWGSGTFCQNGCDAVTGSCQSVPNQCQPFTMKCQDSKYVVWCLDEGNTGQFRWSRLNRTVCEFQCIETITASKVNATCTAHSMTDEVDGVKNLINYYVQGIKYATDNNLRILLPLSLLLSIIAGIVVGFLMRSKMLAVIAMGIAFIIFTGLGWIPWPLTVLFVVIGGYVMFKMTGDEE